MPFLYIPTKSYKVISHYFIFHDNKNSKHFLTFKVNFIYKKNKKIKETITELMIDHINGKTVVEFDLCRPF